MTKVKKLKARLLKLKKEKGKKSPVNDMISLTYIKVRTYLIDLKFRIKQMEVLYLKISMKFFLPKDGTLS